MLKLVEFRENVFGHRKIDCSIYVVSLQGAGVWRIDSYPKYYGCLTGVR